MFAGIVEGKAKIVELTIKTNQARLSLKMPFSCTKVKLGDSIAISGVCLTVVKKKEQVLSFDVVAETLRRTRLGLFTKGDFVNVERSLALGDRVHGHFVWGHVDGTVRLKSRLKEGVSSERLQFELPQTLAPYVVTKGSIAIDGVSLTVGDVSTDSFVVYLVPHTLDVTSLGALKIGSAVNLEIDMLARYTYNQVQHHLTAKQGR